MLSSGTLRVKRIPAFKALYRPKRYKIFFGGRGSGKSWEIAQALLLIGIQQPIRVLCGRELQKSIDESVHRLLVDTIQRLELGAYYRHTKTTIDGINGTHFRFSGIAQNVTGVKSSEGYTHLWLEEAENISEYSWDVLIPTFRTAGSEIIVSFNPNDELDPTYARYVAPYLDDIEKHGHYEDDRYYVRRVNYDENPFFAGTELEAEMLECKEKDYKKYLHIWQGQPMANYEDSIIQPEWFNAAIDAHKKLKFEAKGIRSLGFDPADTGTDAKALAFRHGSVVKHLKQWKDGDVADAIDKAFKTAAELNADDLVYDGIGIGAAVKVHLRQHDPKGNLTVTGFIASESVTDPATIYLGDRRNDQVFRNRRAQWWWYLRDRFERTYRAVEKEEYHDPDSLISIDSSIDYLSALRSELCRVQRKRGHMNTLILIESKDDMRKRDLPSPNMADALVMAFANPPPDPDNWGSDLDYPDLGIV